MAFLSTLKWVSLLGSTLAPIAHADIVSELCPGTQLSLRGISKKFHDEFVRYYQGSEVRGLEDLPPGAGPICRVEFKHIGDTGGDYKLTVAAAIHPPNDLDATLNRKPVVVLRFKASSSIESIKCTTQNYTGDISIGDVSAAFGSHLVITRAR
jgi:hypothetical protein